MNEITLWNKTQDPIGDAMKVGPALAQSGFFGCTKEQQGTVLMLACIAEGKSPFDIIRTYHITSDGKLTKKALAQLAEFRKMGGKHKWLNIGDVATGPKDEDWKAVGEFAFEGNTYKVEFSIADAKRQQLNFKDGSNWRKTPGNMLRARVITNALGMLCPEIVAGSADAPEEEDTEIKNVSPLLPSQPTTITTDKPDKKKANTPAAPIDVQATVKQDDSHPDLKPAAAPVTPTADAKPFKAEADGNGKLTTATVQALQAAIGAENAEVADKWFLKMGWIKTTGGYFDIPAKKAQMFLDNPAKALNTMKSQVGAK